MTTQNSSISEDIRVSWICKNRYMNKRVIPDQFGRLYNLPNELSGRFELEAFALEYQLYGIGCDVLKASKNWSVLGLFSLCKYGSALRLISRFRRQKFDLVISSSDCFCVVLGHILARFFECRHIVDLYDDYTAFGLAKVPGLKWLYGRALAGCDAITVVSAPLAASIRQQYPGKRVDVIESTIGSGSFEPSSGSENSSFSILSDGNWEYVVGVSGGLNQHHGVEIVYGCIEKLANSRPDILFLVAGLPDPRHPLPVTENVCHLGVLSHHQMNGFYNSVDVALIALGDNQFGRYAFPQKAYEILATRTPVVAADVGAMSDLFRPWPEVLYDPSSSDDLSSKVLWQLSNKLICDVEIPTWEQQAARLAEIVDDVVLGFERYR